MAVKKNRKIPWPYIFIAPFFITYGMFNLFPMLFSLYISMTRWTGFGPMRFIGLANYKIVFTDVSFYRSVWNSIVIVIEGMIPMQIFGLTLALILNYGFVRFGRSYVRNAFFIPYVTAPVAIGLIFAAVFDRNFGIVNNFLRDIGLISDNIDWLHTAVLPKPFVAFTAFWRYLGYIAVIYLAGLQAIPPDIYEAATVDGAKPVTAMIRIIIPMLKPTIVFQVTLGIIGCLRTFEEPLMLFGQGDGFNYNGGVDHSAQTMNMKYLQVAFQSGQSGYGAAVGYGMFMIILIFTLVYFWLVTHRDEA
jgi:ABC-type sugar transport system permease subunit